MSTSRNYDFYPERQILIRVKKQKKQKPKKNFWKFLLVYAVILVLIMSGVLVYLWKRLDTYQKNADEEVKLVEYEKEIKEAPQLFFVSYADSMTPELWKELWKQDNPDCLDTDDALLAVMNEKFATGNVEYYRTADYTDEHPAYLLRGVDGDLVKIVLSGAGLNWKVESQEFYISGELSESVTVPSDCTVICNGITLSENYITGNENGEAIAEYQDDIREAVNYSTYTVEGLFAKPDFLVSGSHELANDGEGNYSYTMTGEEAEELIEKAEDFTKSLLYYFKMGKSDADAHMNDVLSHVVSGSKAATVIKASYDGVIWTQAGKNVNYDINSGEVAVLGDNCFYVDVTYHSDDEGAKEVGISDGTYRVYFLDMGKGPAIYNFELK